MKRIALILFSLYSLITPVISQQQKWQKISTGLPDSAIVSAIVQHGNNILIGIFRATGYTYYIPGGVYLSTDNGNTWINRSFSDNGEIMPVSSFLVVGDTIFAGVPGGGIFKSANEGITWEESDNGIFGIGHRIFDFLQIDSLLFVSTQNGVYKSSDYGHNWIHKSNGLPLNYDSLPFQVKTIKSVGNKIYAGVDAGFQMKGGLFVSTDLGETWTKVLQNYTFNGVSISTDVVSIEHFDGYLYIFFNGFWILKSSDEGKTWIEDSSYGSGWVFYKSGNIFLRSSITYLFLLNETNTWSNITYNLPNEIWSIYTVDSLLFAGLKYDGIWKTSLSSISTNIQYDQTLMSLNDYELYQNYPNPFNSATKIVYHLPMMSFVRVEIFDILGRKIKTLVNAIQERGSQYVIWNAQNENGVEVPSGVYYYSIVGDNYRKTKKMNLLK